MEANGYASRLKRILYVLIFLGALVLVLIRLRPIANYNMAHIYLDSYLFSDKHESAILDQAYHYFSVSMDTKSQPRLLEWRMSYVLFLLGRYDEAADYFAQAQSSESSDFNLTPLMGENQIASHEYWILRALNKSEEAPDEGIDFFRKGLAAEPRELDAELYRRYYDILAKSSDPDARQVGQRIRELLDQELRVPIEFDSWDTVTAPLPVIKSDIENLCWQIDNIRYDGLALEQGPLVPVQLEWRGVSDEETTHRTETFIAVNLAPNAGFEWGEEDGQPAGFPNTIYGEDNPTINHELRLEDRLGTLTSIALLDNKDQEKSTSFASRPVEIEPGEVYFQGGWMRSLSGRASIGHHWRGVRGELTYPYQFVAAGIPGDTWQFFGQALAMYPRAEAVDIWLRNYETEGVAMFDNLLLFKLDYPLCN